VCSEADVGQLYLLHGTENMNRKNKEEKQEKQKQICSEESVESVLREEKSVMGKDL